MIIVTGASGFIGSCLVSYLNQKGFEDLILVDEFDRADKQANLEGKRFNEKITRETFQDWLKDHIGPIDLIFHYGARTDTTEFDESVFEKLNLGYSKMIWEYCTQFQVPLIYASSAATYGGGEYAYNDDDDSVYQLKPLNPYGRSKHDFDLWVLKQEKSPPFWAGLKFFNIYGPNEYHKGRMASVVFHAFNQIKKNKQLKLFRSHNADYKDGMQLRDFCYVKDLLKVSYYFMKNQKQSGIYNLGTGKARAFLDLGRQVFKSMEVAENIEFIDTPIDIRDKYQYFTQASLNKLRSTGYKDSFTSLEEGVHDYISEFLKKEKYF